jgi:hypothetical protein
MVNRETKLEQVLKRLEERLNNEYNNTLSKSKILLTTEHRRLIENKSVKLIKMYIKLVSDKLKKIWNPENNDIPYDKIIASFNENIEGIIKNLNNHSFTKTNKGNLKERKLQNELRKKEKLELEQLKRNKSFENKLNNFVNEPILKGITSKDKKLLSSRFNKMPPKNTQKKRTMPPLPKPRGARPSRRKTQQPNVSLNN